MGNYMSCVSSQTVKVILQNGSVQEFKRSVKAAELMLENSQQFVSHASCVKAGKRAAALVADEELQMGQLYLMLPMHKLNSALTASDVASLLLFQKNSSFKNSGTRRNPKGHSRILPVLTYMCPLPVVERKQGKQAVAGSKRGNGKEDDICVKTVVEVEDVPTIRRLSVCRSWKPALETITEVSIVGNSW
ncbi:hypothetical protein SUGI_0102530 [Cryptomeria japonica]|uniref:uncharacterized protein LOC131048516 n=1 Tax=Cryptomeria japonica TaxID=3369 RepID=UPI002408C1B3|nr:uncharacterized protein LOC131048516 [Cryptomeria japonica]GLJ09141.1 hypothetical protein SUGI_0102530 [Cryptomeria japonica]